jgi:hypothetical protein
MEESVSRYLAAPLESLVGRYHLGPYECDLLLWNVKVIADYHRSRRAGVPPGEVAGDRAAVKAAFDACGIPLDYPISATFLPQQLKTILASRQITTLFEFTGWIWRARSGDLLRERQLGKKTLMEIQGWLAALCARDPVAMQAVLPVRGTGVGLDLGIMARLAADQNPNLSVPIMHRRFVGGEPLRAIGKSVRLTGSRVGHAEMEFRHYLAAFLGAMPQLRQSLWEKWIATGTIQPVESEEPRQIRELAAAAAGRIFEASP